MDGYRLKAAFEEQLGPVWTVNFGQIYQVLKDLKRRGHVEARLDAGERHMSRWVYKLTNKGRRSLETWLQRAPHPPPPARDELFIRLLALAGKSPASLLDQISREAAASRERLNRLLSERGALRESCDDSRLLRAIAVEAAVVHVRAHLQWLSHCADVFSRDAFSRDSKVCPYIPTWRRRGSARQVAGNVTARDRAACAVGTGHPEFGAAPPPRPSPPELAARRSPARRSAESA